MPRGLGVDLVDGRDHLAGLSAPSRMRWRLAGTEARVVEDLGARNDKLHRPPEPARGNSGEHRLHLQRVLLAESAAGKGRDDRDVLGLMPSAMARPWRMASAFWVPSWMVSLSPLPFGHRGDQLDRVLVLRRTV